MMQISSQNPVGSTSGYTSTSKQSYIRGRSVEKSVAGHRYNPSSRPKMYKQQQQRRTLPKEATRVLMKWLEENCLNPFPTEEEKKRLAASTNLTEVQVSNWFINARRRQLPQILKKKGLTIEEVVKKKSPKAKKGFNLLNGQITAFNITNENSRADQEDSESGYGMHVDLVKNQTSGQITSFNITNENSSDSESDYRMNVLPVLGQIYNPSSQQSMQEQEDNKIYADGEWKDSFCEQCVVEQVIKTVTNQKPDPRLYGVAFVSVACDIHQCPDIMSCSYKNRKLTYELS